MTDYKTEEVEERLAGFDACCVISPTRNATSWHEQLNGGSGAHRVGCSDGATYAAKFPGTPQQDWILGREFGFTTLANAYDPCIALSVHAIGIGSEFVAIAPQTVSYTITETTAVGTSWVDGATDTKLLGGTIAATSYRPETWASLMTFQTWAGAEDPAALATSTNLFSVDHGFYMTPTTLGTGGPASSVCAGAVALPAVAMYARPALAVAVERLEALPDEDIFRAFAGLPDAWWCYGRHERAEIVTHLLNRRTRTREWLLAA